MPNRFGCRQIRLRHPHLFQLHGIRDADMANVQSILGKLQHIISQIEDELPIIVGNNKRYILSSLELIRREYGQLDDAQSVGDIIGIRFYLRSIADMPKGIIDIGASWDGVLAITKELINEAAMRSLR